MQQTSSSILSSSSTDSTNTSTPVALSWQEDWRLGLLVSSWISSIAGPEGVIAAKSLGSLLLASGLAGSLQGALEDADNIYVTNLFLPAPSMALTVAATSRKNEWSYTDLLSDRLEAMMPILPSLVVSLLSSLTDQHSSTIAKEKSLKVLANLITAVGGAFYRVFGGMTHTAGNQRGKGWLAVDSTAISAAKAYAPHLLVVAMVLENFVISLRSVDKFKEQLAITILQAPTMVQKGADDGSWIEVSSTVNESFLSDGAVHVPEQEIGDPVNSDRVAAVLEACQTSVLTTASELVSNAMRAGGGEASTLLWRNILITLEESKSYQVKDNESGNVCKEYTDLLCRLLAMVLIKCLKRDYQWELWSLTLSAAISRLCLLVEEKELLLIPLGDDKKYSSDQVLLLCAMINVLSYGRDTTGWCQLILPSPPVPSLGAHEENITFSAKNSGSRGAESTAAAAKVMLPVLQPTIRVMMDCVGKVDSKKQIVIPKGASTSRDANKEAKEIIKEGAPETVGLLEHIVEELRHSLMAAVVGMAFANARDVALYAMATLRRALLSHKNNNDDKGIKLCESLLCMTAEEIRVRYEGERRRRETALFDAYEEQEEEQQRSISKKAAADSQAVENLILGGSIVPLSEEISPAAYREAVEEVSFEADSSTLDDVESRKRQGGDDFVLFHEGLSQGGSSTANKAKMDWT